MDNQWIVIGITGVTCGGKTTLSKKFIELAEQLPSDQHVNIKVISQDDYFLDIDDKRHTWVGELQHIHFDIITSLDMDKMCNDILDIIGKEKNKLLKKIPKNVEAMKNSEQTINTSAKNANKDIIATCLKYIKNINILILEGFSIFEHEEIFNICHLKYFFTLDYEECKQRRLLRTYEPPDCDGYFEVCVWPEYTKYLKYVQDRCQDLNNPVNKVTFFQSNYLDRSHQVVLDLVKYAICAKDYQINLK